MGNGRVVGDRLNFQATATFLMTPTDAFRWRCAFTKGSELLYNATEGQLRFGRIFVTTNGLAVADADYKLTDVGDRAFATFGGFGDDGRSVTFPPYAQTQVLSIVHETGHHVFALGEEYSFALSERVDAGATLPAGHGNLIIPLQNAASARPDADFDDATVFIRFGDILETRDVASKVGDRVTVDAAFTEDPRDAVWATFQWDAECTDDRTTGACIMEFSRSNAGEMDAGCNWTPTTNPVTEFCTTFNHDPDQNTGQHARSGEACWSSIVDLFPTLTEPAVGSAADKTQPAGFVPPEWIVLEPNVRVALVLDRSKSMDRDGGSRLLGVQTGATYWIENAAVENDLLTLIWYNHDRDVALPLTAVSALSDMQTQNIVDDIEAQTADGATNIRDALRAGLTELLSPGTAAAVQAALLMTDGAHNTPIFSTMQQAVGEFQEANTNIYSLGVGSGSEVDRTGLQELTDATNGAAFTVDDGADEVAITNRMVETNQLIRGGVITSVAEIMPDRSEADVPDDHLEKPPGLDELMKKLELRDARDVWRAVKRYRDRMYVAVHEVEQGAASATFNLSFPTKTGVALYLIGPDGTRYEPGSPGTTWVTDRSGFRLGKVSRPQGGLWTIIGYRNRPSGPAKVTAVTGIQNPLVCVTGSARPSGSGGEVAFAATAFYGAEATGARVRALVRDQGGAQHSIDLDDNGDGSYEARLILPNGPYEGIIDIVIPPNTDRGGLQHGILHLEENESLGPLRLGNPRVRRHISVTFFVGPERKPEVPEEEEPFVEEGGEHDQGEPVRVKIDSWKIPEHDRKYAKS